MDQPPVPAYGEEQSSPQAPSYGMPTVKTVQPEEPARIGPAGRLIGVLVSPGETFADINRKPTWLVPMLIGIFYGLIWLGFFNWWVRPNYVRMMQKQIQAQVERTGGKMPDPEMIAMQGRVTHYALYVAAVLGVPFVLFLVSSIFTLEFVLFGGKATFKKILSVYAWTSCGVVLVNTLLNIAVLLIRDRDSLSDFGLQDLGVITPTNPGVLMGTGGSPVILSLAKSLDVFSFWQIILLTVGLTAVSGTKSMSKGKAAAVVLIPWLLYILAKAGLAAISGQG
jgi:hypothetical protein